MISNCTTSWDGMFYGGFMPIVKYQGELFGCIHSLLCVNDYGDNPVVNVDSVVTIGSECTKNITSARGLIYSDSQTYFNRKTRPIFGFEDKFWTCISGYVCPEGAFSTTESITASGLDDAAAEDDLSAGIAMGVLAVAGVVAMGICAFKCYKSYNNRDDSNPEKKPEEDHPAAPSGRFSVVSRILGCCTGRTQEAVSVV